MRVVKALDLPKDLGQLDADPARTYSVPYQNANEGERGNTLDERTQEQPK